MEKNLVAYDKEYMKMALLKHEETFREQVYELHRLYQIQKMLMKNIASSRPSDHHGLHQQPQQNLDLERPAEEYAAELDGNGVLEIEDECKIELTLGPSSYHRRRKAETPLTSDSGPSFSSSTGSNHIKRTSSATHQRKSDKTREGFTGHKWGLVEVPDSNPSFLGGRNSSNVEEQLIQDRLKQQPPWLFQVLSLNMT